MILNGLPWKRTETILSFLRLHPSSAFWTLVDYDGYSISSRGFLQEEVIFNNWKKAPELKWEAWTLVTLTYHLSNITTPPQDPEACCSHSYPRGAKQRSTWCSDGVREPSTPASSLLTLMIIQCTCKNDSLRKTLTAVF